jgi:hypothetical protein
VRLVACWVSSIRSVFVRPRAFRMTAIIVYKWLLQSTSVLNRKFVAELQVVPDAPATRA